GQPLIPRTILSVADVDIRAASLVPAVPGASSHAAGKLQKFRIRDKDIPIRKRDVHDAKTPAVNAQQEVTLRKLERDMTRTTRTTRRFCRFCHMSLSMRRRRFASAR